MYPYRYRSGIGLICLILMRNPALLIILLVALALSSELRGCEHHEGCNDAAHVPQKPITKPISLTYARRAKSLGRSVRIATHYHPVEGES